MNLACLLAVSLLVVILPESEAQSLLGCFSYSSGAPCSDLHYNLYSGSVQGDDIKDNNTSWLRGYNATLPTVLLVHGNGGGEHTPIVTLREAYRKLGTHNVIMLDWGAYAQDQCYFWSVWNVASVSRCVGAMLGELGHAGLDTKKITCIGHSLGAHLCGAISNHVPHKLEKIVGLDPAWPLVQFLGSEAQLNEKKARTVQVIHTETGFYGMSGMQGTVDFCVNSGAQPFCRHTASPQLCSHLQSICFYAESLYAERAKIGVRCEKLCPLPRRNTTLPGDPATMGEFLEESAEGMYCVQADDPPYCQNTAVDPDYGDPRCCPA